MLSNNKCCADCLCVQTGGRGDGNPDAQCFVFTGDLLCARRGTALQKLVQQRADVAAKASSSSSNGDCVQHVVADIQIWGDHQELFNIVQKQLCP